MREIQVPHSFSDMPGFFRIEDAGLAFTHSTETAVSRADIAAQHERRGPIRPALENVWALRFLADSVQVQSLNQLEQMILIRRIAQTNPQPFRFRLTRFGVQNSEFAQWIT